MSKIYRFDIEPMAHQSVRKGRSYGTGKEVYYKPTSVKQYQDAILMMLKAQKPQMIFGPVEVDIVFYFSPIPSLSKDQKKAINQGMVVRKFTKPDITDNTNKPFFDALGTTLFENDSRICDFRCRKFYSKSPGIVLQIGGLNNLITKNPFNMFITDGEILIHESQDLQELMEAVELVEQAFLSNNREIKFERSNDPFPHYKIPRGVSYNDLRVELKPNLKFKAINTDILIMPDSEEVLKSVEFTEEEAKNASIEWKMARENVEQMEADIQNQIKDLKSQLKQAKDEEHEKYLIVQKNSYDKSYTCIKKLNFSTGKVYYQDDQNDDIIKEIPMQTEHYQLKVEIKTEKKMEWPFKKIDQKDNSPIEVNTDTREIE